MDTGFEWVKVLLCAHMFQKRCISFAIRVYIWSFYLWLDAMHGYRKT